MYITSATISRISDNIMVWARRGSRADQAATNALVSELEEGTWIVTFNTSEGRLKFMAKNYMSETHNKKIPIFTSL